MRRSRRLLVGAVCALAAVLLLTTPAVAAVDEPQPGPADIAIPYLGEATIEPRAPWHVADCAAVLAASDLVTRCDESHGLTVAAPAYDPDFGTLVLPVALAGGTQSLTMRYRITLEPPTAPTVLPSQSARPVPAGGVTLLPFSEFGLVCQLCAEGGGVRPYGVEPAAAGSVWATATHLVFRAAQGYRGSAELQFFFVDDAGTEVPATVPVVVYPRHHDLVALDVQVLLDESGVAEIDLSELFAAGDGVEATLLACGATFHGRVACDADGRAVYTGTGAADQFGFHVAADGDQAYGSVTLLPAATVDAASLETRLVSVAPADGRPRGDDRAPVPMMFVPRTPEEQGSAVSGRFLPLVDLLGRVAS